MTTGPFSVRTKIGRFVRGTALTKWIPAFAGMEVCRLSVSRRGSSTHDAGSAEWFEGLTMGEPEALSGNWGIGRLVYLSDTES